MVKIFRTKNILKLFSVSFNNPHFFSPLRYLEKYLEDIPDNRESQIDAKKHFFSGYHATVFRGWGTQKDQEGNIGMFLGTESQLG